MARIRTIKPDFFTSEDIVALSPLARLLYVALWCEADREGRFAWKPRTFKMRYLPGDDCDIESLCAELLERGVVVRYGASGDLAFIPAFREHQHINARESESILPSPDTCAPVAGELSRVTTYNARVATREARVSDVHGGKEGKGKEGREHASSDTRKRKTSLPSNFTISESVRTWAREKGHSRLDERLEHFVSTARANGYAYADWDQAFKNAIRDDWAKLGTAPPLSGASLPELAL